MNDDHGMMRYEKTEILRERFLEKKEAYDKQVQRIRRLESDVENAHRAAGIAEREARDACKELMEYMGLPHRAIIL